MGAVGILLWHCLLVCTGKRAGNLASTSAVSGGFELAIWVDATVLHSGAVDIFCDHDLCVFVWVGGR